MFAIKDIETGLFWHSLWGDDYETIYRCAQIELAETYETRLEAETAAKVMFDDGNYYGGDVEIVEVAR